MFKFYAETIRDGEIDDEVDGEFPTNIEILKIFVPSARTVAVLLAGCLLAWSVRGPFGKQAERASPLKVITIIENILELISSMWRHAVEGCCNKRASRLELMYAF